MQGEQTGAGEFFKGHLAVREVYFKDTLQGKSVEDTLQGIFVKNTLPGNVEDTLLSGKFCSSTVGVCSSSSSSHPELVIGCGSTAQKVGFCLKIIYEFLSDPGKPGVRSLCPDERGERGC